MNHKHYFVTGTDTNIGKTYVTAQLMRSLKAQGRTVLGLKPVAAGGIEKQNEDALIYLQENSIDLPYETINPYFLEEPISPHLAAKHENIVLDSKTIVAAMQNSLHQSVDHIFIEGAGGVFAPLNETETMLDLMKAFDFPIILVVGLKLGCLNHALLSMQALQSAGLTIAGWVANPIDPQMLCVDENVETLERKFAKIGEIPLLLKDFLWHSSSAPDNGPPASASY
jgi:dethiobiotin synthetase